MSEPSADRDPFEVVAESFLTRFRAGERPGIEEYAARHPELADQIRELLPALVMVERDLSIDRESGSNGAQPSLASTPGRERRLGDYRILREIGRGGMGVVYEAEQVSLGRRVALKVLRGHVVSDRKALERFRREAKAAARLHHTNIVPVFEVGRDGEVAYYAMQFIQGQGLDEVIDELVRLRGLEPKPAREAGSAGPTAVAAAPGPPGTALGRVAVSLLSGRLATEGAVPSRDIPPAGTERFSRDATSDHALSVADPDHGVPVQDHGSAGSAMLPGGSPVSTVPLSGRRAPFFRSVAQIGRQAAQGLAHAHASGIVHRDIKPSNLLLDHAGTVWITDFGLAKGDDEGLTQSGDILGTIRYMAPERFRGEGDARADVYALGLTLYELLTLRPGFDSPDRLKLIEQIKTEEPQKPRSVDARIPRDLETIVLKAIDKDPKARYQTAEALREDLGRFLADEPIQARQVRAAERYWRWARRNPAIAVLGCVLTAVLIAVTVGSLLTASYFRSLAGSEFLANQKSHEAERVATLERDKAQRSEKAERWGRYRSNIAAASADLQLQNSGTARSALEDAPEEHRNWEWRYLHSQLDGALIVLPVPGGKIKSLVLSPSGRQFAVCCSDHNEVYLYHVATGKLEAVLRGHSAPATSVAYRPDGKQVATIGNDQTIRLWDPATGEQTALLKAEVAPPNLDRELLVAYNADGSRIASSTGFKPGRDAFDFAGVVAGAGASRLWDATTGKEIAVLAKWREGIRPLVFSPDGKRVAVGSREYVHLCDAATGRRLAVLGPHMRPVERIAFSPDGKRIASAVAVSALVQVSQSIYLWDAESGSAVAMLRGHTDDISSVLFSADASRLVSGGEYPDNSARLWDAATGRLLAVLAGHKNGIVSVAFSPDGKGVATASLDRTVRLWDGRTGQLVADLGGHSDFVWHVLFSPNGARVVTASADATLRLWDAQTGEFKGVLRGHGDGLNTAPVFTPDGSRLVSGSIDGTVRIWDMSLVELNGILRGHESFVYDVAFSPNGEQVASAAWDGTARLWNATTGRQTGLLKHETGIITSVAYSGDGRRLATVEKERGITLWDVASRKAAQAWRVTAGDFFYDMRSAVNPAGTLLAAGFTDGPVRLWDVATGREVARLEGHDKRTLDVAFHPDGSLLASAGVDGTVRLWDVATRAPVAVLRGHSGPVHRVAFSADGKLLASGSEDKTIRLWATQTREQLAVISLGSVVYSVAFNPDSTRLAAGCRDNTVRLFDVASRQEVAELRGHTDYVHAVAWSPDGTRLVSGSGDFTVRVWDALSPADRAKRPDALHPPR